MVVSFFTCGAKIAHHPYLKLLSYFHKDEAGRLLPCHYFTTLEFVTAISPYTSPSTRLMYPSHRDRQMKGSLMKGGLTDDRKAGGGVSWQGGTARGRRQGGLLSRAKWNSSCCGQGHGYSPGRGRFTTLIAVDWPRSRGRMLATPFLSLYFLILLPTPAHILLSPPPTPHPLLSLQMNSSELGVRPIRRRQL